MDWEALGIISSLLVIVSFLMNGEKAIRIANIFGALGFVIYGFKIGAFSVWFLNWLLILLHLWKLFENKKM